MSDSSPSLRAPPEPDEQVLYQRPSKLTTICIVSLVICLFALLTAATAASGGMGASNPFSQMAEMGQPAEVVQMQRAMTAEIQAATKEWARWYAAIVFLNLALTGLLVSGSVLALKMTRPGDKLLGFGFAVGIASELVAILPTIAVQRTTMEVMERWMPGMMAQSGTGAELDQTLSSIMRVSMVAGMTMAAIFALAKLGFFAWGLKYLRHSEVRARFAARS